MSDKLAHMHMTELNGGGMTKEKPKYDLVKTQPFSFQALWSRKEREWLVHRWTCLIKTRKRNELQPRRQHAAPQASAQLPSSLLIAEQQLGTCVRSTSCREAPLIKRDDGEEQYIKMISKWWPACRIYTNILCTPSHLHARTRTPASSNGHFTPRGSAAQE